MKTKPIIINQSKFPNTKKDTIFYIRSKKNHSRPKPNLLSCASQNHIKITQQRKLQIQDCLTQLKHSVQEQKAVTQCLFKKVESIIKQLMLKKSEELESKNQSRQKIEENDDDQPCSIKKTFSKSYFASNIEINKNKQNIKDSICLNSPCHTKLKQTSKFKIVELQLQKKQLQQMMRLLKNKQAEMEYLLNCKDRQIESLKTKIEESLALLHSTQAKMQETINRKRDQEFRINKLQDRTQQLIKANQIIQYRLKQRQNELLCLWQSHLLQNSK